MAKIPMLNRLLSRASTVSIALVLAAAPAQAAQDDNVAAANDQTDAAGAGPADRPDENEIVVTAIRGRTNLQRTPVSVVAVQGEALENQHIDTLSDLTSSVPGFEFGQAYGQAQPAIRGIGSNETTPGNDPRVAFYQDDVYLARPEAQMGGLFDIEQLEVLRGPQGALYGRNATAGAILVRTRRPTRELAGYVNLTYGNYDLIQTDGAIGGPLGRGVSARIAWQTTDRDGYGINLVTGNEVDNAETRSVRGQLLFGDGGPLEVLIRADYHRERDRNYGLHYGGAGSPNVQPAGPRLGGLVPPPNSRDIADEEDPENRRDFWGVEGDARLDVGSGITLRSITSYRSIETYGNTQLDGSSLRLFDIITVNDSRQFSQEFQASSDTGQSVSWILGANYFREDLSGLQDLATNTQLLGGANAVRAGLRTRGTSDTDSLAVYGRATIRFSDRFSAIVGGRFSYEKKSVADVFGQDFVNLESANPPLVPVPGFPRDVSASYNSFTPSASLNYQFTPDIFGYASFSRGFKSGGFTLGTTTPAFDPETVDSWEVGLRSSFFDRRLILNVSGYYADYRNLQVKVTRGTVNVTENAASARIYGAEADIVARPFEGFELNGNLAWTHARYTDYLTTEPVFAALGTQDLSGNHLINAPDFSASLAAQYRWPIAGGSLTLRGQYYYSDTVFFTPFNREAQPSYDLLNAFLTFEDSSGHWRASAFIRNIENDPVLAYASPLSGLSGFTRSAFLKPPRTYGLTIGYRF
jgi:iron complex outermembrane receptor protein